MKKPEKTNSQPGLSSALGLVLIRGLLKLTVCSILLLMAGCNDDEDAVGQTSPGLVLIANNLSSPVALVESPDDTKRLFVVDQAGKIWIIDANGTRLNTPFLDVTSRMVTLTPAYDERGLLGFAFHPNYRNNGRFFVYYTAPPRPGGPTPTDPWNNLSRISEFTVSANANVADVGSERIILEIDQPQMNHEGGTIAFGPDGYLYISIGDGGNKNDIGAGHVPDWYPANEGGNGQDVHHNLLGNILRIDVNGALPYSIPADNPYVGQPGMDEIYAIGFRNPYRFSFDMGGAHQLFVGDAGQKRWEEINIVTKGGNYGWNVKEGRDCFNAADEFQALASCPTTDSAGNPLIDPVIEMKQVDHPEGGISSVVVGGYVYRGSAIGAFSGQYIFGSFSKDRNVPMGEVFIAQPSAGSLWQFQELNLKNYNDHLGQFLKGFGQDLSGEVYLLTSTEVGPGGNTGAVYKLAMVE